MKLIIGGNVIETDDVVITVDGDVAHDAVDSGNPVKIGGVATADYAEPAAVAAGDRVDAFFDTNGRLVVAAHLRDELGNNRAGFSSLNAAPTINGVAGLGGLATASVVYLFDGTDYQGRRANTEVTILASAARTGSPANADITNHNGEAVDIIIDVTAYPAAASVVFTVKGKDALSSNYYTILTSAAIVATGTTVLRVGRGLLAAANTVANAILPRTFQVQPVHADGDSITYSIAANIGD